MINTYKLTSPDVTCRRNLSSNSRQSSNARARVPSELWTICSPSLTSSSWTIWDFPCNLHKCKGKTLIGTQFIMLNGRNSICIHSKGVISKEARALVIICMESIYLQAKHLINWIHQFNLASSMLVVTQKCQLWPK